MRPFCRCSFGAGCRLVKRCLMKKHLVIAFVPLSLTTAMCALAGCGADDGGHPFGLTASCDTQLTATVLSRRQTSVQLSWSAPSGAAGYQVRYARVPITFSNFDDTSVSTAVTYSGTPAAAGTDDGLTVS